jgi:transposase-like protein
MARRRRRHGPKFKARVALEAVRGDQTVADICRKHGVHSSQVARWKGQLLDHLPALFEEGVSPADVRQEQLIEELFAQIGRLKVENDFLKKKSGLD